MEAKAAAVNRQRYEDNTQEREVYEKAVVLASSTNLDSAVRYLVLTNNQRRARTTATATNGNGRGNKPAQYGIQWRSIAVFLYYNKSRLNPQDVGRFLASVWPHHHPIISLPGVVFFISFLTISCVCSPNRIAASCSVRETSANSAASLWTCSTSPA